jgi:predicted TPR repeat methyltransferase
MPRSSNEGKLQIKEWISTIHPTYLHILDVATGQGTYHTMFNELDNLKECKWTGIEIWPRWIKKFALKEKYNNFFQEDVRTFNYKVHTPKVDIAFAGDVLEHMTKDESIALVKKLLEVSDNLFVSIPIVYMPQGADGGNPYEIHVKPDWSHTEVLETFPQIKKSWAGKKIGVYWLTDGDNINE